MTVKRLLSIDGGGIRGIIAAEILVEMEAALKRPLCEYFDFISGTSTGAIIAAGLAKGMSASKILDLYKTKGETIFSPKEDYSDTDLDDLIKYFGISDGWVGTVSNAIKWSGNKNKFCQRLLTKYTGKQLEKELKNNEVLGEITLGSPNLKTNLMIVTNNVTRGQNWFFVNNTVKEEYKEPNKYLESHKDIPLWQIVRASSAAPTFFPPFPIQVKNTKNPSSNESCEFIDGGIGSYNNSSWQLFLEAVHPKYGTGWEYGTDKLLLVSIGTGFGYADIPPGEAIKKNNADWAGYLVGDLMYEANLQQNQLIKLISKQKSKRSLNSAENGDLSEENGDLFDFIPKEQELFTYCRFTTSLTVERFKKWTNKGILQLKNKDGKPIQADAITKELVDRLEQLDCVDQIDNLSAIGQAVAKEQFDISLFEGFLED